MKTRVLRRGAVLGLLLGAAVLVVVLLANVPVARGSAPPDEREWPSVGPLSGTGTITLSFAIYLPLVMQGYPLRREVRALWVTRYDWISFGITPTVADAQRVVSDAVRANFNTLFFQVRGAGDAYYTPGPEPWASRLTGTTGPTLGRDPGWDPLATMISLAHASGISVHAYINVYPAWQAPPAPLNPPTLTYGLLTPTLDITPPQWLNQLTYGPTNHGIYGLKWSWRAHDSLGVPMPITYDQYVWASPAAPAVRDSVVSITAYLLSHYALDGIHLDNVRYPGPQYSYDPFTMAAFSQTVQISSSVTLTDWRGDFQRAQVSALVARIYTQTGSNLLLSAAVWPRYTQGCNEYFQDSKAWMFSGTIDAIAPMLYGSDVVTDLVQWMAAAQDFQGAASGRWVLPGIGALTPPPSAMCVGFDQISARIQAARAMGAAGQAIFSYAGLRDCQEGEVAYLDLLRRGPYAATTQMPPVTWK